MKTPILILVGALCALALSQSVELIQQNKLVQDRGWLEQASATYAVDSSGTNVVLAQVSFIIRRERNVDDVWTTVGQQVFSLNRDGVENWVLTYTNEANVVVTNLLRLDVLADMQCLSLLPARALEILRTPQATEVQEEP